MVMARNKWELGNNWMEMHPLKQQQIANINDRSAYQQFKIGLN
jgi:hypothetical protein